MLKNKKIFANYELKKKQKKEKKEKNLVLFKSNPKINNEIMP